MEKQHEALRLADAITHLECEPTWENCVKAAAELRRLSEENTEQSRLLGMSAERELRLRAINSQLLEALIELVDSEYEFQAVAVRARAAISAAKGEA